MNKIEEIPEAHRQYEDGAITMEEYFNKLLMIMVDSLPALCSELVKTNPTVCFLRGINPFTKDGN